jgi:hypothetical protein
MMNIEYRNQVVPTPPGFTRVEKWVAMVDGCRIAKITEEESALSLRFVARKYDGTPIGVSTTLAGAKAILRNALETGVGPRCEYA